MTGHAQPSVDLSGVVTVGVAECAAQAVVVGRDGDDVHVVGHQAIGPDRDIGAMRRFGKEIEIERIVAIFEEGLFAPIATLGDVVWDAWEDDSG